MNRTFCGKITVIPLFSERLIAYCGISGHVFVFICYGRKDKDFDFHYVYMI
jgi:hypothetical protein